MMVVSVDVSSLGRTTLQLLDSIQKLGDNYYRSKAARERLGREVALLKAKLAIIEKRLVEQALYKYMDANLRVHLNMVNALLATEIARLKEREPQKPPSEGGNSCTDCLNEGNARKRACCEVLGDAFFAQRIARGIIEAKTACEEFIALIDSNVKIAQDARFLYNISPAPLKYQEDPNYVPFKAESEVYLAFGGSRDAAVSPSESGGQMPAQPSGNGGPNVARVGRGRRKSVRKSGSARPGPVQGDIRREDSSAGRSPAPPDPIYGDIRKEDSSAVGSPAPPDPIHGDIRREDSSAVRSPTPPDSIHGDIRREDSSAGRSPAPPDPIHGDIRREDSSAVRSPAPPDPIHGAIRREDSSAVRSPDINVVLLHGGCGTGKSTVARQVSLKYQKEKKPFHHVVMLECGEGLDADKKKKELLAALGQRDPKESTLDDELRVLQEQSLLIVLDDIWDNRFLQGLLNHSGPGVKYLVTSQRRDVCAGVNCKLKDIQIDDLLQESSRAILRKIFTVHAQQSDSEHLAHEGNVDMLLDIFEGNPLIIATVAEQIRHSIANPVVWTDASNYYLEYLEKEKPLMNIHGIERTTSYRDAMSCSFRQLGEDETNLLILLGMCRSVTIPPKILQCLYGLAYSGKVPQVARFKKWITQLQNRYFVKASSELLWINSSTKHFVVKYFSEARRIRVDFSQLHSVVHSNRAYSTVRVAYVLACLYLDKTFGKRVEGEALRWGNTGNMSNGATSTTFEPATVQRAPELDCSLAKQVLDDICRNAVGQEDVSQHLERLNWVVKTWEILLQRSLRHQEIEDRHQKLVTSALTDLGHVDDAIKEKLVNSSAVHQILGQAMSETQDSGLPAKAVRVFLDLASTERATTRVTISSHPHLLDMLRESLSRVEDSDLRSRAENLIESCIQSSEKREF